MIIMSDGRWKTTNSDKQYWGEQGARGKGRCVMGEGNRRKRKEKELIPLQEEEKKEKKKKKKDTGRSIIMLAGLMGTLAFYCLFGNL